MKNDLTVLTSLLAGTALAGMVGCARFQDRPLSAEQVSAEFEARSLENAGLKSYLEKRTAETGARPAAEGWDLNRLTLVAFYYHPDLEVARAQLAGAKAGSVTAGQRPNPTLNVSPQYSTTTAIPSPWVLAPTLDLPVETAGKRGYRLAQAAHISDAARFHLAATAWQVRSRVRSYFLALYAANEREAALKKQETIQAESVQLLEGQLHAGAVSPFEVTQGRVALNQTRLALHDAEKQAATARVQLAGSLGLPPSALDGVKLDFGAFARFPADVPDAAARKQALLNRADVLAALADYAASQSALQLEIARQYPDVHISPNYQYDQGNNKWGIGVTLELPVLSQNQGPIAEAEARRAEMAARFNALQARVISEIAQAVAGYHVSLKKVAAAQLLSRELGQQLSTATAMLDAGEISRVELAQRQLELTTAALAQLEARIQAEEALGALEDALQSPPGLLAVSAQSPRGAAQSNPATWPQRDGQSAETPAHSVAPQ